MEVDNVSIISKAIDLTITNEDITVKDTITRESDNNGNDMDTLLAEMSRYDWTLYERMADMKGRMERMEKDAEKMKLRNTKRTVQYQIDDNSFDEESPRRLYNKGKHRSYKQALATNTDTTDDNSTENVQPKTLHNTYRVPVDKQEHGTLEYSKTVRTIIPIGAKINKSDLITWIQ